MRDRFDLFTSDSIEPGKSCENCHKGFAAVGGPIEMNHANLCERCFKKEVEKVMVKVAKELAQLMVGGTKE